MTRQSSMTAEMGLRTRSVELSELASKVHRFRSLRCDPSKSRNGCSKQRAENSSGLAKVKGSEFLNPHEACVVLEGDKQALGHRAQKLVWLLNFRHRFFVLPWAYQK
jgi:hypothetical protein